MSTGVPLVISENQEVLEDINETIFDQPTGRLRHIHQMLDTPSRGIFAPKVLEKLTGCVFNGVVVKEVPQEIILHEPKDKDLFSFQISGKEIINPIKVISNTRSTGNDLMNYFEEKVGLSRQMFRLTWGTDVGSSQLVLYQSLRSQLEQDKVIYLQLSLKGGGGYVRKSIMKVKSGENENLPCLGDMLILKGLKRKRHRHFPADTEDTSSLPSFSYPASFRHPPPASSFCFPSAAKNRQTIA